MKHVIHTDNSEFFRKLMKSFMAEVGLEYEGFESGTEGIEAVKDGRANCIITGLELSDMSGEEYVKRLKVLNNTAPIIVVTSKSHEDANARLKALGVKNIILKSGEWHKELKEILG